jgi:sensor histidine kinase YesM
MFVTLVQAVLMCFTSDLNVEVIIEDALIFNLLFACCAIFLWYPVSFNHWQNKSWSHNFTIHLIQLCLWLSVWLGSGYLLMRLLAEDDEIYLQYLDLSIWWRIAKGTSFYILTTLSYYLYIYVGRLKEKADNELRLNKLIKDGELNLLKSQINPHFLFNSLNSLNALIIKNPERASEMLTALSDYLRYTVLSMRRQTSDLEDEVNNIKRYLSIEKLRFGDKLNYEFHIDPACLPLKAPSMLLQPLLENAVKYGVYESTEAVSITVIITNEYGSLNVEVSNDFDPDYTKGAIGSGTGLKNIAERLSLFYGNKAALHTKTADGKFTVTVNIPSNFEYLS